MNVSKINVKRQMYWTWTNEWYTLALTIFRNSRKPSSSDMELDQLLFYRSAQFWQGSVQKKLQLTWTTKILALPLVHGFEIQSSIGILDALVQPNQPFPIPFVSFAANGTKKDMLENFVWLNYCGRIKDSRRSRIKTDIISGQTYDRHKETARDSDANWT